jgi:hypothetical protein
MSTSDLYRISKTVATHLKRYSNGHGTAPVIWDILCADYLGFSYERRPLGDLSVLWDLAQDTAVPLQLRLVHAFCFDAAIVRPEDLTELADACDQVWESGIRRHPAYVNHWASIALDLRSLVGVKIGRAIGYAISCTSVSDQWSAYADRRGKSCVPFDCVAHAKTLKSKVLQGV